MSSTRKPESSAADPGTISVTRAPLSTDAFSASATSSSTWLIDTPSSPRRTSPKSRIWLMIELAISVGTAKPMPILPPERLKIAELMPTSSPRMLTSRRSYRG